MDKLAQLPTALYHELTRGILPFTMRHALDRERGGFYGSVARDGCATRSAEKGLVQHSRLLWTFAHASRYVKDPRYLSTAAYARQALNSLFLDGENGGYYWSVGPRGRPRQTHKMVYGQAFAIYGLAEYHLATGDAASLQQAIELFRLIEQHCHDQEHGGYWEGCHRDWSPAPGLCVDSIDLPVVKTMNSHLHILEAYTTLLRAWDDGALRACLRDLVQIMLDHVLTSERHQFSLFFDRRWRSLSDTVSYGHDIEGSWLLVEAAQVLGESELLAQVGEASLGMAYATLDQGVDGDGGMFREGKPSGPTERTKDWWPQAEAMVGFFNAYQLNDDPLFLDACLAAWDFVQTSMVDPDYGEWVSQVNESGPSLDLEKSGFWKTPYHNGRACLELIRRLDAQERPGPI